MFDFLLNQDYIKARNEDDFFFFGNINIPIPTWTDVLQEFDREYKIHLHHNNNDIFKTMPRLGFVLHDFKHVPIVKRLLYSLSQTHNKPNQHFTALCYISLSSESETYGRHNDTMDVWCWQMLGFTLWQVEGRNQNFEKILEPGNLIYIPRGMWHNTKPLTPRAGLSFGAEDIPNA